MRTPLLLLLVLLLGLFLAPLQTTRAEDEPGEVPVNADDEDEDEKKKPGGGILEAPGDDPDAEATGPALPIQPVYRERGPVQALKDEGTPAGMIRVPGGVAVIGTRAKRLGELLTGRPDTIKERFEYELPQHHVPMPGFFLDQYEVTNEQYHVFLLDAARVTHKTEGQLASLVEVAGYLLRLPQSEWNAKQNEFWRQLYEANKAQLHEKMPDVVVMNAAGKVDEEKTARAFRYAPLARGLELEFYRLRPPMHWKGTQPDEDLKDHPVRGISYNDAEKYAEWAGKHLPTESEWEYGARGPKGYFYPWGDQWFPDASHANWGGKIVRRFQPITVPVDGDLEPADLEPELEWVYDGMSWCGAWHMLGNVAEWTSSWFEAYPDPDVERNHDWMGRYAKVIRGSGLKDGEQLVLRLAARNYRGGGMRAPPVPSSRFDNVGFRCAWYGNPGQDQLDPILRRVSRDKMVKREMLAMDRWAGAAASRFTATAAVTGSEPAPDEAANPYHVYVIGRASSIILIPLRTMLAPTVAKPKIRKRNDLLKMSSDPERTDPIPLALFHTDVGLQKVYVLDLEAMAEQASARPGGRRRRRQKVKAPPVKEGTCPPGSYVLAFWHERLCIAQPSLEPVCFLSKGPIDGAFLDVKKLKPEKVTPTSLELTPVADLIQFGFSLPVGGKSTNEALRVVVDGVLVFAAKGSLTAAGEWQRGAYQPTPPEIVEAAKAADRGEPAPEPDTAAPAEVPTPDKPEQPEEAAQPAAAEEAAQPEEPKQSK